MPTREEVAAAIRTGQILAREPPRCPRCGKGADGFHGPGEPNPGDITVCGYCAGVNRYAHGLRIEAMSAEEISALDTEELRTLHQVQQMVRRLMKRSSHG